MAAPPPTDGHGATRAWRGLWGTAPIDGDTPPPGDGRALPNAFQRALDRYRAPAAPHAPRVIPTIPESALGFAWPLFGFVTSPFSDGHPLGIDIAPNQADGLVLAARDGVVVVAGGDPCCGYGYFVLLDHGGGLTSIYGHLREAPLVRAGERIERGTVLGVAGNTGHSEGVHLHFEVRVGGLPVDPEAVLTAGHLVPLPARRADAGPTASPEPQPAGAEPPSGVDAPAASSEADTSAAAATPPQSDARADDPTQTSPTPALASTATPVPSTTPAPDSSQPAASAPPRPASAPQAASPPNTATPRPPSSAQPQPEQSPAPTPDATPPPGTPPPGTPSPSPNAAPASPPACSTVRLEAGKERIAAASAGLAAIELEVGTVRSIIAERCNAAATLTVTARPEGEQTCTAALYAAGERLRALTAQKPATSEVGVQVATNEIRWRVEAKDLPDGATLRVRCVPSDAAQDR